MNQSICHGGALDGLVGEVVPENLSRLIFSGHLNLSGCGEGEYANWCEYRPNSQHDVDGRQILVFVRRWTREEAEQLRGKIREAKR